MNSSRSPLRRWKSAKKGIYSGLTFYSIIVAFLYLLLTLMVLVAKKERLPGGTEGLLLLPFLGLFLGWFGFVLGFLANTIIIPFV